MIRQFGPPTFFVTLITCENNWSILMKTLKDFHTKHFQQNVKIIFNDSLTDKDLIKMKLLHVHDTKNIE
jgi:hypothetical protein